MGAQAIGGANAAAATVEGAQAQAGIEKLSREAQKRRFERDIKEQEPFMEAGKKAIPLYQQAVEGKFDVTQSPMYKMQAQMIQDELQDAPEFVRQEAMQGLGVREGELAKGRLLDMQKIGLGMAGSAGRTATSFGNAMSQSLMAGGGALAQGQLSGAMQQQNTWMGAMEQLSGLPAYASQQNYMQNRKANQYEASPEFVGPPSPF
jgi:hypothetical protein